MPSCTPEYAKRWRVDRARGIDRTMPTEIVARHVRHLRAAGATQAAIGRKAGVSRRTIAALELEPRPRMRVRHAQAILAVTLTDVVESPTDRMLVPAIGTQRRIKALLALGHSYQTVAAFFPTGNPSHVALIIDRQQERVTRRIHDCACEAFRALSMTPGRSEGTRRRARRRGYKPPLAWDEGSIDLPDAVGHGARIRVDVVDDVAVQRRMEGEHVRLTQAEATEVVRRLYAQGLSSPQIATRTGLKAERYLTKSQWLEAS